MKDLFGNDIEPELEPEASETVEQSEMELRSEESEEFRLERERIAPRDFALWAK